MSTQTSDCMYWQYPNYNRQSEWTTPTTTAQYQRQGELSYTLPLGQDTENTTYLIDGDEQVKRPMNSFLLWAKVMRKKLAQENPTMHNAQVSKLLGKVWNDMTSSEKRPFIEKAERLRAVHMKEHPNYRYAPKKKKERRSVQKMISPEIAAAFHNAIFDLRSTENNGQTNKINDHNEFGLNMGLNTSKHDNITLDKQSLDLRTTGRDYLRAEDLALSLHFHQLSQHYSHDNSSTMYPNSYETHAQQQYSSCAIENWNRFQSTSTSSQQNNCQQNSPSGSDDLSVYPSSPESNLSDDIPCVLQSFLDNNPVGKQQHYENNKDDAILKDFANIISGEMTKNRQYEF